MNQMSYWVHGWGMYWWIIIIVLVVVGVFFAARSSAGTTRRTETEYDVLRRRYAEGEIDDAEYERRLQELDAT